jgi:hypothetical protein
MRIAGIKSGASLEAVAAMAVTALVSIVVLALTGCAASPEDTIIPDQRDMILNQLDRGGMQYEEVGGVFRHFPQVRTSDVNAATVNAGSRVGIYFELYPATYQSYVNGDEMPAPVPTTSLYSNKPYVQDALRALGLDPVFWPRGPYELTVGAGQVIKGLDRGLVGAREGDSLLLFITSDLAFGNKPMWSLETDTPVLYVVTIDSVR